MIMNLLQNQGIILKSSSSLSSSTYGAFSWLYRYISFVWLLLLLCLFTSSSLLLTSFVVVHAFQLGCQNNNNNNNNNNVCHSRSSTTTTSTSTKNCWNIHDYCYSQSITTSSSSSSSCGNNAIRTTALYFARDRSNNNNNNNKHRYYNNNDDSTIITSTRPKSTTVNTKFSNGWYPNIIVTQSPIIEEEGDEDLVDKNGRRMVQKHHQIIFYNRDEQETFLMELEEQSVIYIATRIRQRLISIQQQQQQQQLVDNEDIGDNDVNNTCCTSTGTSSSSSSTTTSIITNNNNTIQIPNIVRGRFMDLTCTQKGEDILEHLFATTTTTTDPNYSIPTSTTTTTTTLDEINTNNNNNNNNNNGNDASNITSTMIIRGAVMVLQSLCVMGTQVGVKGPPEQLRRMVEHLSDSVQQRTKTTLNHNNNYYNEYDDDDYYYWTKDSVRRLKYRLDRTPAIQLLATLQWKQTPQGAFDLLRTLGVWDIHEDLSLLRSGFPIRFTHQEEQVANDVWDRYNNIHNNINNNNNIIYDPRTIDPDTLLGIRQDLRHLKVYTIDGADAAEIDDGISIETIVQPNMNPTIQKHRHRIWIHIADAESYAPPDSELFEIARRRVTSLYLPTGSISMFPTIIGTDLMSLKVNEDVRALSLGVELNDDGSLNESTIIVTPSLIKVSYRLTYDEVDEMLEEGIGYNEEWEIGALLMAAKKRREFRIQNGSSEGMIPNPVPSSSVSIYSDHNSPDSIGISISIQVSHNAAMNKTAAAEHGTKSIVYEDPASSAYLLVTEAMIMAGEAIGVWKQMIDTVANPNHSGGFKNVLQLPYRTQSPPDFKGRARERNVMMNLLESNAGMGLCHAWYTRRFLESVSVKDSPKPHSGLGLNCYVQWSSPIRRFSDLQVHAAVKRYIRRCKVYDLLRSGTPIPVGVRAVDLGLPLDAFQNGRLDAQSFSLEDLNQDLDFMDGIGLVGAGKKLQRQSQQYWLFEHVRRLKEENPETTFNVVILGCVDPDRYQFVIYVKELGLEHRYISPAGRMEPGTEFRVRVDSVNPRSGLLSFVRVV